MSTKRGPVKKAVAAKKLRSAASSESSGGWLVPARFRESAPGWKENLEDNLVKEGFTRARARELVEMAAS